MRVVALLATYNEERFVEGCLRHLTAQGLETYLIDNGSTDRTVELASAHLGRGLIGIETAPRDGVYAWRPLLERKARLAAELDADWFVHLDADEIRLPPHPGTTLAEALAEADAAGDNAVNFLEFTFVPTREAPDHDHPDYERTMRSYYHFRPRLPDRLNAWKRQATPVDLASSGGHIVRFEGLRMHPRPFLMRHYLHLSADHARRKYVERRYDAGEVAGGWHRARAGLRAEDIVLPSAADLKAYTGDHALDASDPWARHPLFARQAAA
jgi:glycosyltransferase involved in cell wall biosynthesis